MTTQKLKDNWPTYAIMVMANILLLTLVSCPPTTESLLVDGKKITRPELQLELDTIIGTAELRLADLDRQQQIRDLILNNALIMIETGTFNPFGMATALFAFYGLATGVNTAKNKLIKKKPT